MEKTTVGYASALRTEISTRAAFPVLGNTVNRHLTEATMLTFLLSKQDLELTLHYCFNMFWKVNNRGSVHIFTIHQKLE